MIQNEIAQQYSLFIILFPCFSFLFLSRVKMNMREMKYSTRGVYRDLDRLGAIENIGEFRAST